MSEMHDYGQSNSGTSLVSNKTYDILKPLASLYFPLVLVFYGTLSQIWVWPLETQIMATLGAVQVLLGGLLTAAGRSYAKSADKYAGDIKVTEAGAIAGLIAQTGFVDPKAKDVVFRAVTIPDSSLPPS